MKAAIGLGILALASSAQAADVGAGKAKAEAVCGACHGVNGASVSDTIPNLAGQRAAYLENQLKAFKDGLRKGASPAAPTAIMNAMASQLSPAEMADVAAFYATLAPAAPGMKSSQFPNVAKTHLTFPENYQQTFVKYLTINFPATKQVRYYFANPAAVQAAKAGKPLPDGSYLFAEVYSAKLDDQKNPLKGADGQFVGDKLVAYTAMATGAGWGDEFPDMLKNGDWNYAVFSAEKQQRPVNQAECLGCHKPLDKASYVFTLKELAAAGK